MPSAKNLSVVKHLEDQLAPAKALILADYGGLSVADIQNLKAKLRQVGGILTVAKNTLIKIALKRPELDPALQGPTALILALDDAIAPIKALVDFAKSHALNIPAPKAGLLNDRVLTATDIHTLATLPPKNQILSQLLGQLQAPAYNLVSVLSGNFRQLVYALNAVKLNAIKIQKGGDN